MLDIGLLSLLIKDTNFKKPGIFGCTFLLRKFRISQKYAKFKALVVCKGYFSKWAIRTLSSDLDLTLYCAFFY